MDEPAFTHSDNDLFPVCGAAAAGVLHLDEYVVVYVCDPGAGLG